MRVCVCVREREGREREREREREVCVKEIVCVCSMCVRACVCVRLQQSYISTWSLVAFRVIHEFAVCACVCLCMRALYLIAGSFQGDGSGRGSDPGVRRPLRPPGAAQLHLLLTRSGRRTRLRVTSQRRRVK